jgi:hypothetical protein
VKCTRPPKFLKWHRPSELVTRDEEVTVWASPVCRRCRHRMLFHQYFSGGSTAVECRVILPDSGFSETYVGDWSGELRCQCITDEWNTED